MHPREEQATVWKSVDSAILGVRLYDGTGSPRVEDALLLIKNGRVLYAGSRNEAPAWSAKRTWRGEGETLLPCLVDLHVHALSDEKALESFLGFGVGTVRDLGSPFSVTLEKRRLAARRKGIWPRVFAAGPLLTCTGGYPQNLWGDALSLVVRGKHQAAEAVQKLVLSGMDVLKVGLESELGPCLSPTELKAIVQAARENGKRVSVHLSSEKDLELALQAGVDELAHLPSRPVSDELWKETAKRKIAVLPTVHAHAGWAKEWERGKEHPFGRRCHEGFLENYKQALKNMERFLSFGGFILYGTDAGNPRMGFAPSVEEWRDWRRCGVTPLAALKAACWDAARWLGKDGEIGTLTPGAFADFALYASDPLEAPENFRTIRSVFQEGEPCRRVDRVHQPPAFDLNTWIRHHQKGFFPWTAENEN